MATRALTLRVHLLCQNLKKENKKYIYFFWGDQQNLLSGLSANQVDYGTYSLKFSVIVTGCLVSGLCRSACLAAESTEIQQRSEFVTSAFRKKLLVALAFRNRFSDRPYLCPALVEQASVVVCTSCTHLLFQAYQLRLQTSL